MKGNNHMTIDYALEVASEYAETHECNLTAAQKALLVLAAYHEAALTRQRVSPVAAEWQPIETAPTKGVILLSDGKKVSPGGFIHPEDDSTAGWWNVDGDDWEPTHWLPLPQPPAQPATGARTAEAT
jgi:hypothetical protein